jgi:protein required for attachment to host cells
MKIPHLAHVALVDGTRFVLMRNIGPMFEPKLEQVAEPQLEATNFSAGIRNQDSAGQRTGSTDLNELAHGAAAADWLNARVLAGEIEQLVVVADPKTLGEMRRHYHKELSARIVGELDKALATEPLPQIEKALAAA